MWEKSSYSQGNGGQCLEWAPAHAPTGVVPVRDSKRPDGSVLAVPAAAWSTFVAWEKSSYSEGNGGMCVEWAPIIAPTGIVPVRDSKRCPDGPVLTLPVASWSAFVAGVRRCPVGRSVDG
ncbi:DUF397 domain-containing protein [Streptomyces hesseae]|uniref:DUF397 domain-containing protein n=1 Tax=Streptomyces hesseae TaxID=3075519 RepID=A0ABU2SM67_9ACTN|nr:DUF397 domain-containing protein [Streptomyces sp. DSM 40473]MDT0449150.1 DUF397 domain-containing protein [Streptomyces sp. DSM 40473]